MRIHDISWPITEKMTAYKDKPTVQFEQTKTFEEDSARETVITLSAHSGTHIDAPAHFLEKGGTIEDMPLTNIIGPCRVIDLTIVDLRITEADLVDCDIEEGEIILLKTKNSFQASEEKFNYDFVFVEKSAATFLAAKNIKAVGIDYLGIERNQPAHETHCALLEKNIPIIEGLRLQHIESGRYQLMCLPLAVVGLEAAPARAVLIEE